MASFETSGLDDLISDMERRGETSGPMASAMVDAAVEIIRQAWVDAATAHGHIDTGTMIRSIGYPEPVHNLGGILYRDVYPQGTHRRTSKGGKNRSVRNAEKAFILHYGSSSIPASYWVDDADEAAGPLIQEKLEAMWAAYLETGEVPASD